MFNDICLRRKVINVHNTFGVTSSLLCKFFNAILYDNGIGSWY